MKKKSMTCNFQDETVAAYRRTVINEWKREIGAPFIELVGFEKVHQKQ